MDVGAQYQSQANHIGDNNFIPLTSLETAIEQVKKACRGEDKLVEILDDLVEYITDHPERKIVGLQKKLENGNRHDLFARASFLKNKFARRVAKNQMSVTEQQVYIQILSAINTTWYQIIHPKIISGSNNHEVDQLIFDNLIKPIHQAIVRFDSTITSETVCGMLYFLTGKCHLIWEPEC
ncbi:ABC-three component system protein [Methylomicrobium lacus]|uniref:ABC-three component system protein n=1 Tax=Methylomicrobium lacus TaxID=136992 RepID=UPI00045EBCA1|nr:ABC-three component system protein [Methylomicrobium lacus]